MNAPRSGGKPRRGNRNLAVGEVNAKGVNVTHGKTVKYIENHVSGGRNKCAMHTTAETIIHGF